MIMQKTFQFFSDAGHGWMKVKRSQLEELGIEKEISNFSYERGEFVYLEEDRDAAVFCNAYESRFGMTPKFKTSCSNRSRIRGYGSYNFKGCLPLTDEDIVRNYVKLLIYGTTDSNKPLRNVNCQVKGYYFLSNGSAIAKYDSGRFYILKNVSSMVMERHKEYLDKYVPKSMNTPVDELM